MKNFKKYTRNVYTKGGELNLKTMRLIALECGLVKPSIYKSMLGLITVNSEIYDMYGCSPEKEVSALVRFFYHMQINELRYEMESYERALMKYELAADAVKVGRYTKLLNDVNYQLKLKQGSLLLSYHLEIV